MSKVARKPLVILVIEAADRTDGTLRTRWLNCEAVPDLASRISRYPTQRSSLIPTTRTIGSH